MDILSTTWELYSNFAHNLPEHVFSFLIRANLLLACPIAAAFLGFSQGLRSQKVQATLMAIGALAALSIPIEFMLGTSSLRPWLVMVLVLGCWYLPALLAQLAHPHLGVQLKILKYTRIGLAALFILNLFLGR